MMRTAYYLFIWLDNINNNHNIAVKVNNLNICWSFAIVVKNNAKNNGNINKVDETQDSYFLLDWDSEFCPQEFSLFWQSRSSAFRSNSVPPSMNITAKTHREQPLLERPWSAISETQILPDPGHSKMN